MPRADLLRLLSEDTAARVSRSLQQTLAELTSLLALAREAGGEGAAELEAAVAKVLAATLDELARPLFEAHPALVPPALALVLAPVTVTVEEEITTDENELPS